MVRRRELDLVALDEDTPRLLGMGLPRARLGLLVMAVAILVLERLLTPAENGVTAG